MEDWINMLQVQGKGKSVHIGIGNTHIAVQHISTSYFGIYVVDTGWDGWEENFPWILEEEPFFLAMNLNN